VKDSLEQGLEAASTDAGREAESLQQGIRLTLKLWQEVLASKGVEEIDPAGQPFNPDFHEALSIQHSPDGPLNTVLEVIQKGYLLNGRLVRAARVIVSSDGQSDGAH
jgi:molecular chaperone GrpE